ncbi:MAG: sigma-70 family RNA polymerase sigma factor [Bacteroidota bacterium]
MDPAQQEILFQQILSDHKERLYRLCRSMIYRQELIDDLFQEVLLNVWQYLPRFRAESAVYTWLYRIAVNTAISFNKKEGRHQDHHRQIELAANARQEVKMNDEMRALYQAIQLLKEEDRTLVGFYLEGFAYKEIAEILQLSISNVGVRINRIKQRLTQLLNPQKQPS